MAAREQQIIRSQDALRDYVLSRFGVEANLTPCTFATAGWATNPYATSAGPIVWVKSRMQEAGLLPAGMPDEPDDAMFTIKGKRLVISPVARSKMFRTPLMTFPIDLNACRVAGISWK